MHASTTLTLYGVLLGYQKSVGLLIKTNGLCAVIDSPDQHVTTNSGGIIIMQTIRRMPFLSILIHLQIRDMI